MKEPDEKQSADLRLLVQVVRSLGNRSQADLAAAAGVDESTIRRIEKGRTSPSRQTVERLAAAVGLPLSFVESSLLPTLRAAQLFASGRDEKPVDQGGDTANAVEALEHLVLTAVRSAVTGWVAKCNAENKGPLPTPREIETDRLAAVKLWDKLEDCSSQDLIFILENGTEFHTWALAELLFSKSEQAASDSAHTALHLGKAGVIVAELTPCEPSFLLRLKGTSKAFLGNALRVSSDLPAADEAMAEAWALYGAGADAANASVLPEWRLHDLEASLRRDQRLFGAALASLDKALALAPPEEIPRVLLKKASTLEQMGEPEKAVRCLQVAEVHLLLDCDARLRCVLKFNLASCYCQMGQHNRAALLLPEIRQLAAALSNELDLVRLDWLEGKVALGLGRPGEARVAFERVRKEFLGRELAYDFALVSLELSLVLLESGHPAEVREIAEALVWIFEAQRVHQEALAALQVFVDAVRQEAVTSELTRQVVRFLTRAAHDPGLRFDDL